MTAMGAKDLDKARRKLEKMGVPGARRHVLMCVDLDETGCANAKRMKRAWSHLRTRLKERGLTGRNGSVLRARTRCLGICEGGPLAVVYPEGAWYGDCDPDTVDRIVDEHLVGGRIVEDRLIAIRPLGRGKTGKVKGKSKKN